MKIRQITQYLETIAPPAYQESYDNSGLIVGDPNWECTGILVTLDSIEATIEEAVEKGCNMVVAHHPIVFRGLKRINGRNYVERTIIKAIKNDVAIYAIHTNLDNVAEGVSYRIGQQLGLTDLKILAPKKQLLQKLSTFCPTDKAENVRKALFEAGAGHVGHYDECSFNSEGIGTFRGGEGTNPFVGEVGKQHQEREMKIEVILPAYLQSTVVRALKEAHPYEEVAYDVVALQNSHQLVGAGMYGMLKEPMSEMDFLAHLKGTMKAGVVRHTQLLGKSVQKVAVCGGTGSFLLRNAMGVKADVFVTADYKYHEFFDADGQILIADIGHYESEQFTSNLLSDLLRKKFVNFAVYLTEIYTNPVNYF